MTSVHTCQPDMEVSHTIPEAILKQAKLTRLFLREARKVSDVFQLRREQAVLYPSSGGKARYQAAMSIYVEERRFLSFMRAKSLDLTIPVELRNVVDEFMSDVSKEFTGDSIADNNLVAIKCLEAAAQAFGRFRHWQPFRTHKRARRITQGFQSAIHCVKRWDRFHANEIGLDAYPHFQELV